MSEKTCEQFSDFIGRVGLVYRAIKTVDYFKVKYVLLALQNLTLNNFILI